MEIHSKRLLSVVVPAFNEESVISISIKRINSILRKNDINFEIIVCDDGSTDRTLYECLSLPSDIPLRIIKLGRNSGHMSAIKAGLEASKGDFVVTIDADLQDPPEYIPDMFALMFTDLANENVEKLFRTPDVVQAFRSDRSVDTFAKRTGARLYYYLIKKLTGIELIPHAADFRIMTRNVVDKLLSLPEGRPVYRLLIPKLGFTIRSFPITRAERFAGETKYTYRKMFALAIDSVLSFTHKPLRIFAYLGITSSIVLLVLSVLTFVAALFGTTVPGWASIALLILSANAFIFAGIGLLGEYIGRIYELLLKHPTTNWHEIDLE
jgi:glycosyltransferase involved in cell wall biosynthesis